MKCRAVKDKSQNKPKIVCLLSTANNTDIANTKKNDKEGNPIKKPQAILDYNTRMGGVDQVDQVLHQSLAIRKTYKWYKKVAIRLVLHCILNSHRLYSMGDGKSMDFLGFSHSIIMKMLSFKVAKNPRIPAGDNMNRLVGKHFPAQRKVEGVEKRSNKTKQCRVCYARGLRTLNGKPIVTFGYAKTVMVSQVFMLRRTALRPTIQRLTTQWCKNRITTKEVRKTGNFPPSCKLFKIWDYPFNYLISTKESYFMYFITKIIIQAYNTLIAGIFSYYNEIIIHQ